MDMEICETRKTTLDLLTHVEHHLEQISDKPLLPSQGCPSVKVHLPFLPGVHIYLLTSLVPHISVAADSSNCTAHTVIAATAFKTSSQGSAHGRRVRGKKLKGIRRH